MSFSLLPSTSAQEGKFQNYYAKTPGIAPWAKISTGPMGLSSSYKAHSHCKQNLREWATHVG
jgi:hypothetical protein